jgi:ABC-2 type transport system ATP-binding protein
MGPAIETRALQKIYPAPAVRRRGPTGPQLAPGAPPTQSAPPGAREIVALEGLDLAVQPGEFFGLLGPNGAGKTTTIGVLTTRVRPTSGSAAVAGIDVVANPVGVKQRIGVVPQRPNPDRQLTAVQNLLFHAAYFGIPRTVSEPRAQALLDRLEIGDRGDARVDQLSGGQQQRLMIARALIHEPDILFLDEPTVGLDPQARLALWEILRSLHQQGRTIIMTTHYMEEADRLCQRLAIIDRGRLLALDTPAGLKARAPGGTLLEITLDGDYRILIIEDQREMRENLATILEMESYVVLRAANGREGLEMARAERPDLVLCDVMMPQLDGHGVLQALRDDPATAGIPFIFLTAKGDKRDLRAGMNLGADDYLTKPVTVSDLLNAVVARLARAAQRPAAAPVTAAPGDSAATVDPDEAVLRKEGEFWTVGDRDSLFRLRDTKGLGYLAVLLANPGRELHALELEAGDAEAGPGSDAGEALDASARTAYRRRLEDLASELEEARGNNDVGRVERLEAEIDTISQELERAFGLGGRARRVGSAAERARINVTRAILGAVRKIEGHSTRLGRELSATVRTGAFCAYEPDPSRPLRWRV